MDIGILSIVMCECISRRLNKGWARPDRIGLNLTLRCNLTCTMCTTCYDAPELSLEEIKDIIDQTSEWGVEVFNPWVVNRLCGRTWRRYFFAVSKGFYVTITTNGTLISKGRAKMLARIPSDRLHLIFLWTATEIATMRFEGRMYDKAIQGYTAIPRADAEAGIQAQDSRQQHFLHRQNLSLHRNNARVSTVGFDGVQVLNLFRTEEGTKTANELWFQPADFLPLESVCQHLLTMKRDQGLSKIPSEKYEIFHHYYRKTIDTTGSPLLGRMEEFYINADGQAIMCDGKLDFLNGAFGSVREQSLQDLWNSETLRRDERW